jgi:FixJ family two-component response regulator
MSTGGSVVFVVDDDPGVRKALARLLRAAGFEARCFSSPADFLKDHDPSVPGCLVLDLALPGVNGLELQTSLAASGCQRPIVFISGHGDVPQSVQAMKAGAVDFLVKPIQDEELLAAVGRAIERERTDREDLAQRESINKRLATLTHREIEVLQHIVSGQLNKQIAAELGTVEKTIKVHRARVMAKMDVDSVAELVRATERVGVTPSSRAISRWHY